MPDIGSLWSSELTAPALLLLYWLLSFTGQTMSRRTYLDIRTEWRTADKRSEAEKAEWKATAETRQQTIDMLTEKLAAVTDSMEMSARSYAAMVEAAKENQGAAPAYRGRHAAPGSD